MRTIAQERAHVELMIELEGDQLKAHGYNDVSDAPATLRVRTGAPIEAGTPPAR